MRGGGAQRFQVRGHNHLLRGITTKRYQMRGITTKRYQMFLQRYQATRWHDKGRGKEDGCKRMHTAASIPPTGCIQQHRYRPPSTPGQPPDSDASLNSPVAKSARMRKVRISVSVVGRVGATEVLHWLAVHEARLVATEGVAASHMSARTPSNRERA